MKKFLIFLIIAAFIIVSGVFIYDNFINSNNNSGEQSPGSGTRLSTTLNQETQNNINTNNESTDEAANKETSSNQPPKETELSGYSTNILDDTPGRLTNISITCSTLNNTIVHAGETFSFNEVIGKPTADKGYQEAKIIVDHEAEMGIGGGNCQVSSTLYDALLNVPSLVITERHEHGKNVGYVPKGRDATVSYGSLDLKFRNDLGHDIRIDATTDNKTITVKIIQLG